MAKVGDIRQPAEESPAAFLERITEGFRQYTPMDPEVPETRATSIMAFINQAAPERRRKLHKVDRLGEKTLPDLFPVAGKVYNTRETAEDREDRLRAEDKKERAAEGKRQARAMAQMLMAIAHPNDRQKRTRETPSRVPG